MEVGAGCIGGYDISGEAQVDGCVAVLVVVVVVGGGCGPEGSSNIEYLRTESCLQPTTPPAS